MAATKSFAVIGLGQFGRALVDELIENGMDVIAIDTSEEAINKISKKLPTAFVADSTNEQALKELGIQDVDAAIVAYGDNKEASILTTVILREFGIEQIIVRVDDDYYVPIMKKLGATEVIMPQKAAGVALANRLGNEEELSLMEARKKIAAGRQNYDFCKVYAPEKCITKPNQVILMSLSVI